MRFTTLTTATVLLLAASACGQPSDAVKEALELLQRGDTAAAAERLDAHLKREPKSASAWLARAQVYQRSGDAAGARTAVDRSLGIAPEDIEALKFSALLRIQSQAFAKAEADVDRALKLRPQDGELLSYRGYCRYHQGKFAEAVDDYTRALESLADDHSVWDFRGDAYAALAKWDKAIEDYTRALRIDAQKAQYWTHRAFARIQAGDPRGAVGDLSVAIELAPDDAGLWNGRSEAYSLTGQWEYSHRDAERSVALDSKNPRAWNQLGVVRLRLGRPAESRAAYSKAIELDGKNALFLRNRAALVAEQDDWKGAAADYAQCLKQESAGVFEFREAALVAVARQDQADCLAIFRAAEKRFGAAPDLATSIGLASIALLVDSAELKLDDWKVHKARLSTPQQNTPVQGLHALIAALVLLRLNEPSPANELLDAVGPNVTPAELASVDFARAIALQHLKQPEKARQAFEAGRARLPLIKSAAPGAKEGVRLQWQGRVLANWLLRQAGTAISKPS